MLGCVLNAFPFFIKWLKQLYEVGAIVPIGGKGAKTGLQKSATNSTVGKHDGTILTALRKSKAFLFHTTPLLLCGIKTQESHSPILLGLGNPSKEKFVRWKVLFIPKVSHFML